MSDWGYCSHNGPHTWGENYPLARGDRQSPIDIPCNGCVTDEGLIDQPFQIEYPNRCRLISNTGNGWKVGMDMDKKTSVLQGGPLSDTYRLEQFHCHWGSAPEEGSEHTVDGVTYPAELHLVHWNDKYGSLEEAADKEDGLAVFGVFLTVGEANAEFSKLIELLPRIEHKGDNFFIEQDFNPAVLLPENKSYWTYNGSLTTPPCLETVTWIVFKEPVQISEDQLNAFRSLRSYGRLEKQPEDEFEGKVLSNYRPPVEVGERTIRSCDFN